MPIPEPFLKQMTEGYTFSGGSLVIGAPLINGDCASTVPIRIPLRTMNRHGLIAGATGTGKTKTLQAIAEQLSLNGVPSLLMDIKGDLSGIAAPATVNGKITERHQKLGIPWEPANIPVDLLTLSDEPGARLRATVSEFGPVLLSRILDLNDTQQSVLALVFKYCDDNALPLLDLNDLRRVLQFTTQEGKAGIQKTYGSVSPATVNIILRKLIELEQQGGERFFGERSFDPQDLLVKRDGKGTVHIVRLTDMQSRPLLFSTFMLSLLAEVYATFPEVGDPEKPVLCLFIDEAHLIFDTATPALLQQIETIIKLIRSKGVGVYFCTQNPIGTEGAACATCLYGQGPHGHQEDGRELSAHRLLQDRGTADVAGHRRGHHHRAQRKRHAHAAGPRPAARPGYSHGRAHARRDPGIGGQ